MNMAPRSLTTMLIRLAACLQAGRPLSRLSLSRAVCLALGPLLALGLWLEFPAAAAAAASASHQLLLGSEDGMLTFEPSTLTIRAGDVVEMEVRGLGPHNLIVDHHPEWSHERLVFQPGERWQQRFDTPGRFSFWCEPHRFAGMEGTLIVEEP